MQPRNYFTDAAEYFLSHNTDTRNMSNAEYYIVKNKIEHWVKNGICFTLPPSGRVLSDELLAGVEIEGGGLLRPPYPVCILEYPVSDKLGTLKLIAIVETVGDQVSIDMMSAAENGAWTPPAMTVSSMIESTAYAVNAGLPEYIRRKESDWTTGRNFRDDAKLMIESLTLRQVYEFVYAVNCFHTTTDEIEPPQRLNRKRLKNGKVPLFTYKVLTIGKKKRKSAHMGGTHASPRSHLRRGYYRMSKNGKRHWVQPCMVKGETPGFVHKDYKVEEQAYA